MDKTRLLPFERCLPRRARARARARVRRLRARVEQQLEHGRVETRVARQARASAGVALLPLLPSVLVL